MNCADINVEVFQGLGMARESHKMLKLINYTENRFGRSKLLWYIVKDQEWFEWMTSIRETRYNHTDENNKDKGWNKHKEKQERKSEGGWQDEEGRGQAEKGERQEKRLRQDEKGVKQDEEGVS